MPFIWSNETFSSSLEMKESRSLSRSSIFESSSFYVWVAFSIFFAVNSGNIFFKSASEPIYFCSSAIFTFCSWLLNISFTESRAAYSLSISSSAFCASFRLLAIYFVRFSSSTESKGVYSTFFGFSALKNMSFNESNASFSSIFLTSSTFWFVCFFFNYSYLNVYFCLFYSWVVYLTFEFTGKFSTVFDSLSFPVSSN